MRIFKARSPLDIADWIAKRWVFRRGIVQSVKGRITVMNNWEGVIQRADRPDRERRGNMIRTVAGLWVPTWEWFAWSNLIPNAALNDVLDVWLSGGTQDTSWFVGLLAASPSPASGWTATEIATNDFVDYDEADLQAWVDGGVSSQAVDNSGSPAVFTISQDASSIGGAYLIGTNAKGTPAGVVASASAFTAGNKGLDDDDTLSVTSAFSAADDGV